MSITTTLNEIRKHRTCQDGWEKLLDYLGKTKADDEPLPFLTILESNGFEDTCWAMQTRPDFWAIWRHFRVDCAERVKHLMEDQRSLTALEVARRHANGEATDEELTAARTAAREAAWEAARAAVWEAARAWEAERAERAERDAARYAAWYAARTAARTAADDGEWEAAARAARYAAEDAWDTELKWQTDRLRFLLEQGHWTPVEE
jgi:hypothetical protein